MVRKIEAAGTGQNILAVLPPLLAEPSSYAGMGRIHRDSVEIEEMLARASLVHYSCLRPTMASEGKVRSEGIHTC